MSIRIVRIIYIELKASNQTLVICCSCVVPNVCTELVKCSPATSSTTITARCIHKRALPLEELSHDRKHGKKDSLQCHVVTATPCKVLSYTNKFVHIAGKDSTVFWQLQYSSPLSSCSAVEPIQCRLSVTYLVVQMRRDCTCQTSSTEVQRRS